MEITLLETRLDELIEACARLRRMNEGLQGDKQRLMLEKQQLTKKNQDAAQKLRELVKRLKQVEQQTETSS